MKNIEIDVKRKEDIKSANKKIYYFLNKENIYRCFLVDENVSFTDFYNKNYQLLGDIYKPIYRNREIYVIQNPNDLSIGSYILLFEVPFKNKDAIPESFIIRAKKILETIRNIMIIKFHIRKIVVDYDIFSEDGNICLALHVQSRDKNDFNDIVDFNKIIMEELKNIKYKKLDDELFNEVHPLEKKINLCIAKNCFVKCKGCYNHFCKKDDIKYEKIVDFLEYAKGKGLEKVTLSGGDPLTLPYLPQLIKKCINLKLKINLDTVGLSFIDKANIFDNSYTVEKYEDIDLLKNINMIGIPLDGSNNEIVSKFRLYNGNLFEKQLEVLNLLDNLNINVCINTVFHKGNSEDMLNIYNIIKKHKCVKKWQVFQFMSIGPLGSKNKDMFEVSNAVFNDVEKEFDSYKDGPIKIEFKNSAERSYNYMLVNSNGDAYKVDLGNNIENFGNIGNKRNWGTIMRNLF